MANRPLKRTVKIVLKARDQRDPLPLLEAVEQAFRPGMVEIHVEPETADVPTVPDEQLETAARSHVAEVLDRQDEKNSGSLVTTSTIRTVLATSAVRVNLKEWLTTRLAAGWRITAKIAPVVEGVVKAIKAVKDLGG